MVNRMRFMAAPAGILLLLPVLLAACGGGDAGLTRAEVEEIVRGEVAGTVRGASSNSSPPPKLACLGQF